MITSYPAPRTAAEPVPREQKSSPTTMRSWRYDGQRQYSGFNDAAIVGVLKGQFRPGMRSDHNVNTHRRVPINFRFADQID